jgi:carbon monoxide dehydrogenase subunit G
MRFELKHTFDAPVDAVLDGLCDPAFPDYMKANMKSITDMKSVERNEAPSGLSWKLRVVPVPLIKRVGPKEVPPEALAFVQESQLDRAGKRLNFKNVADHPRVKKHLENGGSMSFRDVGGRTERTISGELKVVNLPFFLRPLSGIAESIIYSEAQKLLNEEASVFSQFLKSRQQA